MSEQPDWLNGWRWSSHGWTLESVVRHASGWEVHSVPAAWLLEGSRLFEPTARPFARSTTRNFQLRVSDLARLAPLLEPGRLLAALVPPAHHTHQDIFAVPTDEARQVYLPAALLLRELWMWNSSAMEALLTPNSLALYLGCATDAQELHVEASGPLAHAATSDTGLRRLSWLAQCADAQSSWSSVLSSAHSGELRLRLPHASLEAWAWGIELPSGTLVAELSAVTLSFELPREGCHVHLGRTIHICPLPPQRRPGMVSF